MNKTMQVLTDLGYTDIVIYPDGLIDATLKGQRILEMRIQSFDPLTITKPKSIVPKLNKD